MHDRTTFEFMHDRTTFEFRKIYIFMQCAPDHYEFFQSIFGLIDRLKYGRCAID